MNQLHALADTLQDLSRWNAFRLRLFFEGIVVGIAGGFTIGSFIWALDESGDIFFPHILNQPYLMAM